MVLSGDTLVVVVGCGQKTHFGQAMTLVFSFVKGGGFVGLGGRSLRCFYFLVRRK